MAATAEWSRLVANVVAHGGDHMQAILSAPQPYTWYFQEWLRHCADEQGADCYPYGHGLEGAVVLAVTQMYGWWHDDTTGTTRVMDGTDTSNAVVFGYNLERATMIRDQAVADGLTVVCAVRMDTNEVI